MWAFKGLGDRIYQISYLFSGPILSPKYPLVHMRDAKFMNSPYIVVQKLKGSASVSIFWLCQFNSYKTEENPTGSRGSSLIL